jgi:integrase
LSRIRVKKYAFNGITFVSLVDENDCPADPYAACYLNRFVSAKSFNTVTRYANELMFALDYWSARSIDVTKRVADGEFFGLSEYAKFYEHCHFQKSFEPFDSNILPFRSVENKFLRNAMAANLNATAKVSPETISGRIRRFRQYMEWLFSEFHGGYKVSPAVENTFSQLIAKIKLDENSFGNNADRNPVRPEESVMPDDVFSKLLEMILPSSPNNPFKSSKVRNYLIVSMFCETGMRRGALAKLKLSDCKFYGVSDRISITGNKNDITDPRVDKPRQKTLSHDVPITDKRLIEQIKVYIDHIRTQFTCSERHDFIFVSEKDSKGTAGQPLSLKSINNIFQKLSNSLEYHVHPHLLRHKWNEIFSEAGESTGVDKRVLEDMRKYAMGWKQDSNMGEIYNDVYLQKKTAELMLEHQKRIEDKK